MAINSTAEVEPWDGQDNNDAAIFAIIMATVTVAIVSLRVYVRLTIKNIGVDDYLAVVATVMMLVQTTLVCIADFHAGNGKPLWAVSDAEWTLLFKLWMGSSLLYPLLMTTVRMSVLTLYLRILSQAHRHRTKLLVKVLMLFMIPYVVIFEFLIGFACKPFNHFWHPFLRNAACGDVHFYKLHIACYSISLGFDVILVVLPIPTLWSLELPKRQKFAVMGMLCLGASACIGASYRLICWVVEWARFYTIDPRWAANPLSAVIPPQNDRFSYTYWIPAETECTLGIIGCSLPALKPLLVRFKEAASTSLRSRGVRKGLSNSGDDSSLPASKHQKQRGDSMEMLARPGPPSQDRDFDHDHISQDSV